MAEILGILFLCACGLVCVVIPCLIWLAFMVGLLCEAWGIQ